MNIIAFIWPHHTVLRIVGVGLPFEDKCVQDWVAWDEGAGHGNIFPICYLITILLKRNLQTTATGKY